MATTAFVLLAGAACAQIRIARFTAGGGNVMLARAALIVTGIAFAGRPEAALSGRMTAAWGNRGG